MRRMTRSLASFGLAILILFSIVPLGITSARQVQLHSRVELVVVPVTAKDKNGKLAVGLTQSDFSVAEAGKKQTITTFSIDPIPISAVILIDTGISEEALMRLKNSFPALIGAFGDEDEIAVLRFDKDIEKLMDFSTDRILIEKTFEKLTGASAPVSPGSSGPFSVSGPVINGVPITPGVNSAGHSIAPPTKVLHDAVFQAAEDLAGRSPNRRRIVLIASDGRNQNSVHSYDAALARLLMGEVHVFAFGVDTSLFQRLRSNLLSYTKATGGDAWFPDSQSALESSYFLSTEQARNQYVLGYVSTNKPPSGKPVFREIKVQVLQPGIDLRYKKGYYQAP